MWFQWIERVSNLKCGFSDCGFRSRILVSIDRMGYLEKVVSEKYRKFQNEIKELKFDFTEGHTFGGKFFAGSGVFHNFFYPIQPQP